MSRSGKSRTKELKSTRQRIKAGQLPCAYCGGAVPGVQVDHAPPRILFREKRRPDVLIFPACAECNQGTRDVDQLAAWASCFYPQGAIGKKEISKRNEAIRRNNPEAFTGLTLHQQDNAGAVIEFDHYLARPLRLFAAKMGMALHFALTGRYVPVAGTVVADYFTNHNAIVGSIPANLFQNFADPGTLWQGRKHVRDQFEYASMSEDDGRRTAHLAAFRASFFVVAFVDELEIDPPEAGERLFRPGCLKGGYPFGLPRLDRAEIVRRARQMNIQRFTVKMTWARRAVPAGAR